MEISNREELKKIILKYGVILIVYAVFSQFLIGFIASKLWDILNPEIQNQIQNQQYFEMIIALTNVLINSTIAIIIFLDMKRLRLGWIVTLLALFYPAAGAMLLIICKALLDDSV